MTLPRLPSEFPGSRLRFVLTTGISEAELMPGHVAFEGTKQIQPDGVLHFDWLQHILFFADKVVDEIVSEETNILEKTIL